MNVLLEERTGAVWCGTGRGLYRLKQTNGEWTIRAVEIGLPREVENDMRVRALVEDRQGALWIGAGSGLYRRWPDGRTERYTTEHGLPGNEVRALVMDANAHLWVGTRGGLSEIALEPGTYNSSHVLHRKKRTSQSNIRSTVSSSRADIGSLEHGSLEFAPDACLDGSRFVTT